jgi:hypothetical protein
MSYLVGIDIGGTFGSLYITSSYGASPGGNDPGKSNRSRVVQ